MAYTIGIDVRKLTDFGIGTYIEQLITALAKVDHDNEYVLFARPEHYLRLAELPDNFRTITETSPVYSVRELIALAWRILRCRLDLYHSTHYVLPAFVPCKVVVTIHDIIHLLYPEFLPHAMAFFYANRMIRRSLTRADRIIANSQNTKTDLLQYFEVDGEKIQVIYHGVADRFRHRLSDAERQERLRALGFEAPYVLFVGNPKPHKNLDTLIEAFAKAKRQTDSDAELVCVGGEGPETARLKRRAAHLGVGDQVRLIGRVGDDELPAIYQGARLFVYPTLYEGFGFPVVEAMASGVPVVTSNKSALREIAEGYADLVDPVDVDGLARTVAVCLTDDEHREALIKLGHRRAADFEWQRTAERTRDLYLAVLGDGDQASGD